jgi:succinate dehydrogenase / fumarate reductase iron-sulfur subunit
VIHKIRAGQANDWWRDGTAGRRLRVRRAIEVKKTIRKFKPRKPDAPDGSWRMQQEDVDRVQEFRKCIECFLCQDVCHVLRDHHMHADFIGPRFLVCAAALEMHPLDTDDRLKDLKDNNGIGLCNITRCCGAAAEHEGLSVKC